MRIKAKRIREQNSVRLTLSKAQALTLWRILSRSHILDNRNREAQIERDEPVSMAICRALADTGLEFGA